MTEQIILEWIEETCAAYCIPKPFAIVEALQASRATPADHSKLMVWSGAMPESNGKTNFTAILHRGDISKGFTIERSEYPDRVRYEADCVRWLIGEIDKEPWILDYDADKHSGYVAPADYSVPVAYVKQYDLDLLHDYGTTGSSTLYRIPFEDTNVPLYAAPQAPQSEAQSVRDAALDEAAAVLDRRINGWRERKKTILNGQIVADELEHHAHLIRALKSAPPQKPSTSKESF